MYHLFGFPTQNTLKVLYVLEELNVAYDYRYVDLYKGEQKRSPIIDLNPHAKVPVLEHDGKGLFESGAICRYLANNEQSHLYPSKPWQRAMVDQWLDFFSIQLGRHLSRLFFEKVFKPSINLGKPNETVIKETTHYALEQLSVVDSTMEESHYLANNQLSIADLFALAYMEQVIPLDLSLNEYPNIESWFKRLDALPSVKRARNKIK